MTKRKESKWSKSLRDALLGLVGIVLAGMIAKYADIPARVSALETSESDVKAAILDMQSNIRTILSLERDK